VNKILWFLVWVAIVTTSVASAQNSNLAFFDASDRQLNIDFVELERWSFFTDRLLYPPSAEWENSSRVSIHEESRKIGFGTFALVVLITPALKNSEIAIDVPSLFSSYELFANGKSIGSKGKVGKDAQSSSPDIKPAVYSFVATTDTVLLVLHASNFYPNRGGIKGQFKLGSAQLLGARLQRITRLDYILFFTLFIIAVVSLCLYYIRFEHKYVFLFLSIFLFSWLMRCLVGYYYRILDWANVSWVWLMRLEYLSLMFTTVFAMLFIASLFQSDFQKWVKTITVLIVVVFSVTLLVLPSEIFVPAIWIYLGFSSVVLFYIMFVIMKAFVNDRGGASMMLMTMFAGSLTFGYVIICFLGYFEINMLIYDFGFIVLAILIVISVSVRLSRIDRLSETNVLTMEHFFGEKNLK